MTEDFSQNENEEKGSLFADVEETVDKRRVPVKAQLTVIAVLLLFILGGGFTASFLNKFSDEEEAQLVSIEEQPAVEEGAGDPFAEISLLAESAFVWDVSKNEVLFEKEPDKKWPLASVTKLMTIMLSYELSDGEKWVSISESATEQAGDSSLIAGENFKLRTLSDFTLMTSSNDGAYALAASTGELLNSDSPASAFVRAMNVRADELGLSQTYFRNPTGLDLTEDEAGAYGSARDVAFLMSYILKNYPEILEASTKSRDSMPNTDGAYHDAENTNPMVDDLAGLIGSKTGYTTLAGGNLVVAYDASINRPIVVSVLGSSYQGRFSDVLKLAEAARAKILMEQ